MSKNNKKKIHEQLIEVANTNIHHLTMGVDRACKYAMKEYDDDLSFEENSNRVLKKYVDGFLNELEINIAMNKLSMKVVTGAFKSDED